MKYNNKILPHFSLTGDKIVDYQGCDVDTTQGGLNLTTGVFTAIKKGLYRFHFHARVQAGKKAYANIMKGSTKLAAMGNTNINSKSHNTMSNAVITTMEVGEQVHVRLCCGPNFKIYSDRDKYVVFEGFFLAPL